MVEYGNGAPLGFFTCVNVCRADPRQVSGRKSNALGASSDWPRLVLPLLYMLNLASSYLIMLVVMTFNGGLFLTVLLGLGVGYGMFGYHRGHSKQSSDLCHVT